LVATSHESEETVRRVFQWGAEHIDELRGLGVTVRFDVDATELGAAFPDGDCFDRIVWNFPCVARGIGSGKDGQNEEMEQNKTLVRAFCASAASHLAAGGEVHMTHKTKPPYNHWSIAEQATAEGALEYSGSVVFDKCNYPPYTNRKALDHKSFPITDAETYVFCKVREGSAPSPKKRKKKLADPAGRTICAHAVVEAEATESLHHAVERATTVGAKLFKVNPTLIGMLRKHIKN